MTRVFRTKVCGVTRVEDAAAAVEAGVDAIGCLVGVDGAPPDEAVPEAARLIFASLPPSVRGVLVTHRTSVAEVVPLVQATGAGTVQLHGAFPLEAIEDLRRAVPHVAVVKAAHVEDRRSIDTALKASGAADAVLLDSRSADRIGGTGRVHDWSISARIVAASSRPVILAGGLTPENVGRAIDLVRPFGVDVNTGVRGADGAKSHDRIRAFVAAARAHGIR